MSDSRNPLLGKRKYLLGGSGNASVAYGNAISKNKKDAIVPYLMRRIGIS